MTPRQSQLLSYIETYIEIIGNSPSYDELREALGLKAKSAIHRMVLALEAQGKIRRTVGRHRSIETVPQNPFDGVPSSELRAELARRGECAR
jgi:repressor LexA